MKSPRSDCNVRVQALINGLWLDWKIQNQDTFFPFLFLWADDGAACFQKPRRQDRAAPLLHLIGNKIPAFSLSGLKNVYTSVTRWLVLVYQPQTHTHTHSFWQGKQNMVWGYVGGVKGRAVRPQVHCWDVSDSTVAQRTAHPIIRHRSPTFCCPLGSPSDLVVKCGTAGSTYISRSAPVMSQDITDVCLLDQQWSNCWLLCVRLLPDLRPGHIHQEIWQ